MYKASYKDICVALYSALAREGVKVGNTADIPRVELHTFIEGQTQDKGGAVRVITCTMESLSPASPEAAADLNAGNLTALDGFTYQGENFRVFGVIPTQLNELTETSDPQAIVYRVLQTIDIYVQQL